MTYYLTIHRKGSSPETIPYQAKDTREAIVLGRRLYEPRAVALYAQIKDHCGIAVCTLGTNALGLGKTRIAYQQKIECEPPKYVQGEIWKQ